jgi:peptide/nickel transport system substrate-binding protein
MELRPGVRFHDGSPVTASIGVGILSKSLPAIMGPAYEDLASIEPVGDDRINFKLRRPSTFLLECLEAVIRKSGTSPSATGAFIPVRGGSVEMVANDSYYLGRPMIDRIVFTPFPSVRSAWAELLRNNLDVVYEVGEEGIESLQTSTTVNVFSYTRHYQYLVILNSRSPVLKSPTIRRALNVAIDRKAFIKIALDGRGVESTGPVWPKHWALPPGGVFLEYDPVESAKILGSLGHQQTVHNAKITFRCLISRDDERAALVVKRQLDAVGVEMVLEEVGVDQMGRALQAGEFDAIFADAISGPSMFRPYRWWHSRGSLNRGIYHSPVVDDALDSIRGATTDAEYRLGVVNFQRAIADDPPAIFLAWDERARAVSRRFDVPAEPGVDILTSLRLWHPAAAELQTSRR